MKQINTRKLIVVGDKVLIKPVEGDEKTASGLYLPPGVQEKEKVQSGYVVKTGPGYAIPNPVDDEPWKENKDTVKYLPLQAQEGDLAIFLKRDCYEIEYEKEKFLIVSHNSVLMLIRDDMMFM